MKSFCPSCGSKVTADSQFCVNCGYNLNQTTNMNSTQTVSTSNSLQPNNEYSNGIGIAGFVISLISLLCCCGSLSWLSLIFSIVGLKDAKSHNGVGAGLSMAGLIISILGLSIILLYLFFWVSIFVTEFAFLV